MNTIAVKNQIMDLLQWSSDEYDKRLFQSYYNYCIYHGSYPSIIQQLFSNSKLNKWFLHEYEKAEQKFLKIAEVVPNSNIEFLRGQYKSCTADVIKLYSSTLMTYKKNKDFSNIFFDQIVTFSN